MVCPFNESNKLFTPERIGMEICPNCNSLGRVDGKVCSICGGFGLVRKSPETVTLKEGNCTDLHLLKGSYH